MVSSIPAHEAAWLLTWWMGRGATELIDVLSSRHIATPHILFERHPHHFRLLGRQMSIRSPGAAYMSSHLFYIQQARRLGTFSEKGLVGIKQIGRMSDTRFKEHISLFMVWLRVNGSKMSASYIFLWGRTRMVKDGV